jgi:6-phosphofructokinase
MRRIGILTGGGDCPGLNAVIRAVVKTAVNEYEMEVFEGRGCVWNPSKGRDNSWNIK